MKESIIVTIATVFATLYNIALIMSTMESANNKFETTSALLSVFNTIKDIFVLIVILSNIFL